MKDSLKPPTEKSIMLGIISALGYKGWRVFRMPPSLYASKGVPDLHCLKNGVGVWIEVKSAKGKLSDTQERFGQQVTDAGGLYIVARSVEFAVSCCEKIQLYIGWEQYLVPSKEWRWTVDGKS